MSAHPTPIFMSFVGLLFAAGLSVAQKPNADDVKERLEWAKKEYAKEASTFKKVVNDIFDKQEEEAREKADKKAVDRVMKDRKAFTTWGDLPATAPKQQMAEARSKLERTYSAAIKDYIRLKMDDMAAAIEKEREDFLFKSANLAGKQTYLVSLKHFNLTANGDYGFSNTGTGKGDGLESEPVLKLRGELVPHNIYLVPPTSGISQLSYNVSGKGTILRATVGIPKIEEDTGEPASALTFEILGDNRSLWKSKKVTRIETFETCTLKLERVKVLTLRVHCPGANAWARTVWFEPILIEP